MQRALILACCLFWVSSPAMAEHFYTWVDAQGHLHATKIQEPENPIVQRADAVKKEKQAADKSKQAEPAKSPGQAQQHLDQIQKPLRPAQQPATRVEPGQDRALSVGSPGREAAPAGPSSSRQKSSPVSPGSSAAAVSMPPTSPSRQSPSQPALSRTSAPESETSATASVGETSAQESPAKPKSTPDSSNNGNRQYNLKNYPDGEDLARHGYVRDRDHRPFFDWTDASGVHHVTEYQPPPDAQAEKEASSPNTRAAKAHQAERLYTQAQVLRPGMGSGPPKGANPAALRFLGLDKTPSLFASFASHCCSQLARANNAPLPQDRSIEIKLDDDASVHEFSSGKSHYRWVRLPAGATPYDLNIRSFIHHGVFVPSVVLLTSELKITRVMTDMLLDYVPENWYRYGYLHARIQVHPEKGERWLLIYTRRKDVKDETVVDEGGRHLSIPHKATGSIALEKLAPGTAETASLW